MTEFTTFTDESGRDHYFVVGSLTSTAGRWTALEADWHAMLAKAPAIPYFKFNNFHRLSKADHGAKIDAGIALINKHVLRADASIVDVDAYRSIFRGLIGVGHDTPPLFGYMQTIMQVALHCPDANGRIEYIFDTIDSLALADLQHSFAAFAESCPNPDVKSRLHGSPKCMDDKSTTQLQAADLWAGVACASMPGDPAAMNYLQKVSIPNRAVMWDKQKLATLLSKSAERVPDILSGRFYETKAQRRRRLSERETPPEEPEPQ